MTFIYKTQKIAGGGNDNISCKVASSKLNLSGGEGVTIIALVTVSDDSGKADVVAKDVLEIIFRRVEEDEISSGMLALLASAKESALSYLLGKDCQVSFKTLLFFKDACFIASFGEDTDVWVYDPPDAKQLKFESGSGKIHNGQLFLLGTKKFFQTFDVNTLEKDASVDLDDVVDGLATELNVTEGKERIAAAFVRVEGEEEGAGISEEDEATGEKRDEVGEEESAEESREFSPVQAGSGLRVGILGFLGKALAVGFGEVRKLIRGDIRAVFRLKRNLLLAGIILFLLLFVSLAYTLYQRNKSQDNARIQEHLIIARSKLEEGSALITLNKERARSILLEAQNEVNAALGVEKGNGEAKTLLSEIEAKLRDAEVVSGVNLSTYYEGNFAVSCLASSPKNLIVVGKSSIATVDLVTKKGAEETSEIGGENCSFFDNKMFITDGDKISKYDLASDKISEVGKISGGMDLGVFIGNVYLLKRDGILKIVPTASGYSEGSDYLNDKAGFGDTSKFAIDGSIWVATGDKIKKFLRGEDEGFSITGVSSQGFSLGLIYTNENLDDLFVVDKASGALLVVGKDGVYKQALQSAEFGRASDILVSEDGKKLFVASGNKVLEANLE
ncbi:hypothetical protein HY382_00405 [Candidatus Curtissbacteria bacterium]|nr:hypothetical protein [Candidatus Curtissbacteria bacterium]